MRYVNTVFTYCTPRSDLSEKILDRNRKYNMTKVKSYTPLIKSIKKHGIKDPLLIRNYYSCPPDGKNRSYVHIGKERYLIVLELNLGVFPAFVMNYKMAYNSKDKTGYKVKGEIMRSEKQILKKFGNHVITIVYNEGLEISGVIMGKWV